MFEFLIIGESVFFLILTFVLFRMFQQENEDIAARKILVFGAFILISFLLLYLFKVKTLYFIFLSCDLLILLILIIPFNPSLDLIDPIPKSRIDERDIMFSRKELVPGSERFIEYYNQFPEKELKDDQFRREPGLLSKNSKYFHSEAFEKANQYFEQVGDLYPEVYLPPNSTKKTIDEKQLKQQIEVLAKSLGAISVGFTKTQDYHYYSHKGRREEYGMALTKEHPFAIALTVEMDHELVMTAPRAGIVMESAKQYYESGKIAIEISKLLRSFGYDARAHIDGNYRVICPLVARDAGLGEIGRMGLLMTPELGPRVRIAVVTTEAVFKTKEYKTDNSVLDFCRICKKCAECCPSQSISFEDPKHINGIRRWQIDQESCFTYWCKVGTDCGRCMAVCPYSHPNHSMHKLIRIGIKNSKLFRWFALGMDDLFYGSKPKSKPMPNLDKFEQK